MFTVYRWTYYESEALILSNAYATLTVEYDINELSSATTIGGQYSCAAGCVVRWFQVGLAPYITLPPSTQYTTTGSNITFICEAVGFPTPNITWETDTGDIDEVAINSTIWSTLTISYVTAEDHGAYKCIADNGNTTDATATLIGNRILNRLN